MTSTCKKVLIIDDEEDVRSLIGLRLRRAGYDTVADAGRPILQCGAFGNLSGFPSPSSPPFSRRIGQIIEQYLLCPLIELTAP